MSAAGLFETLTARAEASFYDANGRCRMCGAHRDDHGVGDVCPQERGESDLRGYPLNPAWA